MKKIVFFGALLSSLCTFAAQAAELPRSDIANLFMSHFYEGDLYTFADTPKEAPQAEEFMKNTFPNVIQAMAEGISSNYRENEAKSNQFYVGKPVFVSTCFIDKVNADRHSVVCRVGGHRAQPELFFDADSFAKAQDLLQAGKLEAFLCQGKQSKADAPQLAACRTVPELAAQWGGQEIAKIERKQFSGPYFMMAGLALALTDKEADQCRAHLDTCWIDVNSRYGEISARVSWAKTEEAFTKAGIVIPHAKNPLAK